MFCVSTLNLRSDLIRKIHLLRSLLPSLQKEQIWSLFVPVCISVCPLPRLPTPSYTSKKEGKLHRWKSPASRTLQLANPHPPSTQDPMWVLGCVVSCLPLPIQLSACTLQKQQRMAQDLGTLHWCGGPEGRS